MDILSMLKQWEELGVTSSLQEHINDLEAIKHEIQSRINSANKELFLSKPKFLPEDVREEIETHLAEWNLDGVEGCEYCAETDFTHMSDEDLLGEYSECVDYVEGEEKDELLEKALGYQAEHKMLSGE